VCTEFLWRLLFINHLQTRDAVLFKIIVLLLLAFVLVSLGSALVAMARGDQSDRMVKSLTWRIGLSVLIFVLLMVGQKLGFITPHGLGR
jgi:hypothetical protein